MQFVDKACKFLAKSTGVAVEKRWYIPLQQNWGRDLSPSTHFSAENIVSLAFDKLSATKVILGRSTKCEHRIAHYLRHRWLQSVHFISCNNQKRHDAGSSKHLPAQALSRKDCRQTGHCYNCKEVCFVQCTTKTAFWEIWEGVCTWLAVRWNFPCNPMLQNAPPSLWNVFTEVPLPSTASLKTVSWKCEFYKLVTVLMHWNSS